LLGTIADLLIDLKGKRTVLVVISKPALLRASSYAAPLRALSFSSPSTATLDIDRTALTPPRIFTDVAWQKMTGSHAVVLYRYSE